MVFLFSTSPSSEFSTDLGEVCGDTRGDVRGGVRGGEGGVGEVCSPLAEAADASGDSSARVRVLRGDLVVLGERVGAALIGVVVEIERVGSMGVSVIAGSGLTTALNEGGSRGELPVDRGEVAEGSAGFLQCRVWK